MNKHLTDGQLRAALDNELDVGGLTHLESCLDCQARQITIQAHSSLVADKLAFLASDAKASHLPASVALQHFNQEKLARKEIPMFKKIFASSLVRYGVPAILAITVIFAVPSVRAFASELLNLDRKSVV